MKYDEDDDIPLVQKGRNDLTDKDWDIIDEYEFGPEWVDRDDELSFMDLEEYNERRCEEEYGLTDEERDSGDQDEW